MILSLKSSFSSAHFYTQPLWSEKRNIDTFGRCYTPFGHGHNYTLEIDFYIPRDQLFEKKKFYQILMHELTTKLDHEHLNFVIPEFKKTNPTTENLTLYFLEKLKFSIPIEEVSKIRVYEMHNLWAELVL